MERPNAYTSCEGFDLDVLFDEDTNNFDFPNIGYSFQGIQDAPLLEETRQTANEVPGSEVESEGSKARDMRSHNITESTIITQSVQTTDANSEFDAPSEDKLSRKRRNDREYRARQKAIKQKQDQEITKLRQELEVEKQKAGKPKSKSTDQINDVDNCRIVFELDFPNNEAKAEVMKLVGGLPDITSITMEGKRLSLKGIDIDPLALSYKLKNICETKLVRFYLTEMKKEGKIEAKKEEMKMDGPYPYPRGPMYRNYPRMSTKNYGAMRMSHFSLKEAGTIFLAVFLSLLLLRLAPYANVLIRSGAWCSVW